MTQTVKVQNQNSAQATVGALAFSLLVLAGIFLFVANVLLWADLTLFDEGEFTRPRRPPWQAGCQSAWGGPGSRGRPIPTAEES
jgi:hypothetical protein